MKKYIKYFIYILEHKKNVFIECITEKRDAAEFPMLIHAFTHDMSKFSPSEFPQYARFFFGERDEKIKKDFKKAWQHHKDKNKHHPQHWREAGKNVPFESLRQMVIDWKAMSRKMGGSALEYYLDNYFQINLNSVERAFVEYKLDLWPEEYDIVNVLISDYISIEDIIKNAPEAKVKDVISTIFKHKEEELCIDIYKLVLASSLKDK